MEDPGPATARSRCRDHSDEAIIPFGVPSCPLVSVLWHAHPPVRELLAALYEIHQRQGQLCARDAANGCPATSRSYSGRTCTACCRARQAPAFLETLATPSGPLCRIQSRASQPMPWPLPCTQQRAELSVDLLLGEVPHATSCRLLLSSSTLESKRLHPRSPGPQGKDKDGGKTPSFAAAWRLLAR